MIIILININIQFTGKKLNFLPVENCKLKIQLVLSRNIADLKPFFQGRI